MLHMFGAIDQAVKCNESRGAWLVLNQQATEGEA
jgi:hypothetical protein